MLNYTFQIYLVNEFDLLLYYNHINYIFPLQLLDSIIMFGLFLILIRQFDRQNELVIVLFFSMFGSIKFIENFFRYSRNIMKLNLTLEQIVCTIFIVIGLIKITSICIKKSKK